MVTLQIFLVRIVYFVLKKKRSLSHVSTNLNVQDWKLKQVYFNKEATI